MSTMSDVTPCECFARDGLQHEPQFAPTAAKRALLERFATLGFPHVEAASYANPRVVPQFADASELLDSLARRAGTRYKATCANPKAVERALADAGAGHISSGAIGAGALRVERALADAGAGHGADEISLLVSATESHAQKNLGRSRAEQWANVAEMVRLAGQRFRLIGVVFVAFGCPFEGRVDPGIVAQDVAHFVHLGVRRVALGDTTGMATPVSVRKLFESVSGHQDLVPVAHFHDTRGTGLANCVAAREAGVRHFDCAFGGVGGHPAQVQYGGGFTGNVCTDDLVGLFESMGVATGIDLDGLIGTARSCEQALGRELHGRVTRSGLNPLR